MLTKMYRLPLLPGYGPNTSVRSSALQKSKNRTSPVSQLTDAEETGYQGSYFIPHAEETREDGYITTSSPVERRNDVSRQALGALDSEAEPEAQDRTPGTLRMA